jgi:hypothetical protein
VVPARPGLLPSASLPEVVADGRYAVVTSRTGDLLRFIDTGMEVVPRNTENLGNIAIRGSPKNTEMDITGDQPTHIEGRFGFVVVFFDGSFTLPTTSPDYRHSHALAIPTSQLGQSLQTVSPVMIFSDWAHHGNAWPALGCTFIRTVFKAGRVLPDGFESVDMHGKTLQTFYGSCPEYHGTAFVGDYISISGCGSALEGGGHMAVLTWSPSTRRHTLSKISYPESNKRTGTLLSAPGQSFAIAAYGSAALGYNAVMRVSPTKGRVDPEDILTFPLQAWPVTTGARSVCAWNVQDGMQNQLLVTLPDGYLYIYNTSNFAQVPRRADIFPELRANLTRANYSCTGRMATTFEPGVRFAYVRRNTFDPTRVMQIDLTNGMTSFITLAASLNGSVADMLTVEPPTTIEADTALQCIAGAGFPILADPNSGILVSSAGGAVLPISGASTGGSDGDDDEDGTIIALAIALAVIIVVVLILAIVVVMALSKSKNPGSTKASNGKFDNPLFAAQ